MNDNLRISQDGFSIPERDRGTNNVGHGPSQSSSAQLQKSSGPSQS